MIVSGFVIHKIIISQSTVMMHPTEKTNLPSTAEIMPSLIDYRSDDQTIVMVEIANNGSTPLIIQPNALLCQLQKVDVCTNNDSQKYLMTSF